MQFRYILWGSENLDFYYLPILKNAQTWGKYFFQKNFNFEYLGDKPINIDSNEKKVIVFYRDPMSRWFSGAAQWFAKQTVNGQGLPVDYKIEELMMELVFSAGKLDAHTLLQREAFAGLSLNNCIFFDVENINFEKNLIHYLENVQNVKVKFINLPKINIIEENPLKLNIREQLKKAYNNNKKFKEDLLQHLYFDIEIYSMLKNKNMFYITE